MGWGVRGGEGWEEGCFISLEPPNPDPSLTPEHPPRAPHRMIESGDIHAQINDANGMVRFLHDASQFNNAATAALLDEQIRKCTQLAGKLQAVHDSVSAQGMECRA
jgi:hypothetical protein